MNDSNDLKLDALLSDMESMQDQLEKQHTQLETLRTENYKALKTVSDLSSENSTLRKELQKKSDKIVVLNGQLKEQSQIEAERKKSEEAMRAGQKAQREAEAIRSRCECKQSELDDREAEIKRKECELTKEIENEAEIQISDLRFILEEEYKRKEEHIWQQSLTRERVCADKYKKLTIRYQAEFTIILFYGVIVTALKAIATPEIIEDVINFFSFWWKALVDFVLNVIGFGHSVAKLSEYIPNPTVASIVFWMVLILIAGIAIGIVFLTILSVIIIYVRYLKENQFDRYTVIAAITALAFTVFLSGVIKGIAPVNLFALQIGLFLSYSGVRAWIARKKYK